MMLLVAWFAMIGIALTIDGAAAMKYENEQ
jgi:hypothetical protein